MRERKRERERETDRQTEGHTNTQARALAGVCFDAESRNIKTRLDTRHRMRLVCVLFTFLNNTGHMEGRTDRRTQPHIDGASKKNQNRYKSQKNS